MNWPLIAAKCIACSKRSRELFPDPSWLGTGKQPRVCGICRDRLHSEIRAREIEKSELRAREIERLELRKREIDKLVAAVSGGDLEAVRLLAANMNKRAMYEGVKAAAEVNSLDALKILLEFGAAVNSEDGKDSDKYLNPVSRAVLHRNAAMTDLLLRSGAIVELCDDISPLHWAAAIGEISLARLLLSAGANPNIISPRNFNLTPCHFAAVGIGDQSQVLKLLSEAGADLNARLCATNYKFLEDMFAQYAPQRKLLLNKLEDNHYVIFGYHEHPEYKLPGSSIHIPAERSMAKVIPEMTSLHLAILFGCEESVRTLLSLGADVHAICEGEITAAHFAAVSGNPYILWDLSDAGARMDTLTKTGLTPKAIAVLFGNEAFARKIEVKPSDAMVRLVEAMEKNVLGPGISNTPPSPEIPHSKLDPWEAGKLQDQWTAEARQGVPLGTEVDNLVRELLQISPYFHENPRVMEIGRILWRKGGVTLMAKVACRIRAANASSSVLDAAWEGIGDATDSWGCTYEGTPR
jgi:ankyrin repeat protein